MFSFNYTRNDTKKELTPLEIERNKKLEFVRNRWYLTEYINGRIIDGKVIFYAHICSYPIGFYDNIPDAVKAFIKKKRELFGVPENLHLINETDTDDEFLAKITEDWEMEFGKIQDSIN